jgi:hypothetical protein
MAFVVIAPPGESVQACIRNLRRNWDVAMAGQQCSPCGDPSTATVTGDSDPRLIHLEALCVMCSRERTVTASSTGVG